MNTKTDSILGSILGRGAFQGSFKAPKSLKRLGTSGRTRTATPLLARDFESHAISLFFNCILNFILGKIPYFTLIKSNVYICILGSFLLRIFFAGQRVTGTVEQCARSMYGVPVLLLTFSSVAKREPPRTRKCKPSIASSSRLLSNRRINGSVK